jgi:hypothetical protein
MLKNVRHAGLALVDAVSAPFRRVCPFLLSPANGPSLYKDGLSLYKDGLSLYKDGPSLYKDGLSLYKDGLSLYGKNPPKKLQ